MIYRCLFCDTVNDAEAVRMQGTGRGFGLRLVAIQAFRDPAKRRSGRIYTDPDPAMEPELSTMPAHIANGLLREIPTVSGNITAFGISTFADLLTPRQQLTMCTFAEVLASFEDRIRADALAAGMEDDPIGLEKGGKGALAYAEAVTTYLGLTLSRMANRVSTMTIHNRANGSVEQSFVQPAYAFYGDFPEANPFSGSTGSWGNALEHVWKAVEALPMSEARADVRATSMLGTLDGERGIVSTDPPYYDMFDYAALSNWFYMWLRASLADIWPNAMGSLLTPTAEQIVSNPSRFDGDRSQSHEHFEQLLMRAFIRMREVQDPRFPMTIYYGYQQTLRPKKGRQRTAWQALLESVISAGLRITSTWPLRTERPSGVKKGSNSLATSVLLVCRPSPADAPDTYVADFRRALRDELRRALRLWQQCNIAPVDLAHAAIGPGMAVFTSFARVVKANGEAMSVRGALEMINQVLDEETLEGAESDFDADTRWAITWFEERGFDDGPYGRAEQLSKSRNTSIHELAQAGVIAAGAGRARLLGREELNARWDPDADNRLTVWKTTQHLIRAVEKDGESAAAALVAVLGADYAQLSRELAYHLHKICQRKGWRNESASLNGLVMAWPELLRLARRRQTTGTTSQLFGRQTRPGN